MIYMLEYTSGLKPENSAPWRSGSPMGEILTHLFTVYS